ncbi:MAG: DUF1905 domain-containing protein [Alphaproteobacteria bacterium]|nr:DUF1905 domain-containing protein [Alphaproteobacteria bacterium]
MPKFKTKLLQAEKMDAMGIEVPPAIVEALGSGRRPKVKVTLKGYSYRSTVAVMRGKFLLPLAKVHREASGVKDGETVEVTLDIDDAPRTVEIPKDLAAALKKAGATKGFDALSYTFRKEHVRSITEAKAEDTRARRIDKAVAQALTKKV